ncbi:MAG TPA: glycosyltransferase 87 family protein [Thermoleophilaceae bacterium]|nr:glycosyltransferase 87 family protein [Thermoleophilaceae bacterium]
MTAARAGALVALAAAFGLTFALDPWQHEQVSDIPLYRGYAELFIDGALPYWDVGFEYPPLAAPVIALPGLVSVDLADYRLAFAVLAALLAAGVLLATGRLAHFAGGREWVAMAAVALAPVATGAMLRTHFDLAPVLCMVAGLAAVAAARPRVGFAVLGIGAALKAFPLAAALVAAAWLAGRGRRGEAALGLAITVAVTALAAAGAVALSAEGALDAVEYHLERPVQIESLPAAVLNGIEAVGGRSPEPVNSHRSDGLEHPAADALQFGFSALLLAALLALALAARRVPDARGLALAGLGTAAAIAALGKVVSPQFMVWVVPLAAVAWSLRLYPLAVVASAAIATTLAWFPARYFDLVARDDWLMLTVAVRNALLLVMLVLLALELRRLIRASPGAAGSTPPARPSGSRPARR